MANNDEIGLIVLEKNLDLKSSIDGLSLKKVEMAFGEIATITSICYIINRFNSNFNVGKSLTPNQSALLASDIVEKFPHETIEDIVLMLKMVRQGSIGDGKDYKLDGQNVMAKWIPEYLDRKYAEIERQRQKEKYLLSSTENNAVEMYYAKMRKKKAEKEKIEATEKEIDDMCKLMDRQMLEDTILDWSTKPDMIPFLDYLKKKRLTIKK